MRPGFQPGQGSCRALKRRLWNMHVYAGTFLIASSALALEICLVRLLSVTTWYHLSFFAISAAMLGMTAGASRVYLTQEAFTEDRLAYDTSRACLAYAWSIPLAVILLCLIPLELQKTVMSPIAFLLATLVSSFPFYFTGIAVTLILTRYPQPIGRLYASDLIGASMGCLVVLGGLALLDAPSLMLLCGAAGALAALCFVFRRVDRRRRWLPGATAAGFVVVAFLNGHSPYGIRPLVVKGRIEVPGDYMLEEWNSFSRIVLYPGGVFPPQYWGPSPLAPRKPIVGFHMNIDGEAGTFMRRFKNKADIEHLRYDVVNIGYHLGGEGKACIIGVGGGRDVQSALLFGHEEVVGIDVNPIFIRLLQNRYKGFAGIGARDDVRLLADDARSYLSRTEETFSIIQMSLIDTWAATGAGAFSLTENALYTTEAWEVFLDRLAEGGIFTVSRWFNPKDISETGRLVSLAVSALLELGVETPSDHLALIAAPPASTLLVSRRPLSDTDIETLREACAELRYTIVHLPGVPPDHPVLRGILLADSRGGLHEATTGHTLNFTPPTDENPYFFNMLRLRHLVRGLAPDRGGIVAGNLTATLTLLVLLLSLSLVTVATIVVPLLFHTRGRSGESSSAFWHGAAYFSLIGAAFMFLEIALIQKLSVFLGHPTYALGVLLFTIIASSGAGSYLSEFLPLARKPWIVVFPLATVVAIFAVKAVLSAILVGMITQPTPVKIAASVAVLSPLGILMGFFFPTGMRIAREVASHETQWYWALNGVFGVLCSALALFVSIYFGISTNLYIAAVCYAAVTYFLCVMGRSERAEGSV